MLEKTCILQEKLLQGILICFLKLMPYVTFVLNVENWNKKPSKAKTLFK